MSFLLDQALKLSPGSGYAPKDAIWQASTTDFPRAWARLEASEAMVRLRSHVPQPWHAAEIAFHERTGVRPTPMRWAVWLGRRGTAAGNADGVGVTTRPGILLHGLHHLRRWGGSRPDGQGVYTFRDIFYGWRSGFLVLSTSPNFVATCLDPGRSLAIGNAPGDGVHLRWLPENAQPVEAFFRPGREIALEVVISGGFESVPVPSHAPWIQWPEPMLLTVAAQRPAHLEALARVARAWVETAPAGASGVRIARATWERWALPPLAPDWDAAVADCVVGVDVSYSGWMLPDPTVAAVFRGVVGAEGPHPLQPWLEALDPIPFEWEGSDGGCATLLGDGLALCLAASGAAWLAASNEDFMARLAAHGFVPQSVPGDVLVALDWQRVVLIARQALLVATRNELLPGQDVPTIQARWGAWLDALAAMGHLHLSGTAETGGRMRFMGTLTHGSTETVPW